MALQTTEKRWGPGVHDADGRLKVVLSDSSGSTIVPIDESAATATLANVNGSASSVTIQAANTGRRGWTAFNDSSSAVYIKFGATASTSSFTVKVPAGGYYEMPKPVYAGVIDAIWDSATGAVRVTEFA